MRRSRDLSYMRNLRGFQAEIGDMTHFS